MKTCTYCGRENPDTALNCSGCGLEEFKDDKAAPVQNADESDDLVLLTTCAKLVDADLIVSRLDAAGIHALIPDEHLMQTIGFNLNTYGYVRVQVRRQDYADAKALLQKTGDSPASSPPATPTGEAKKTIASLAAGQTGPIEERLKQAGVPFEVKTTTEESGLETSEILVDPAAYDRGCQVAEAWADDMQENYRQRHGRRCPNCNSRNVKHLPHETLGYIYQCEDCGHEFPE